MKKLCVSVVILWLVSITNVVAFEKGWVLNVKANVGGSLTLPAIAQDDLDRLGAQSMKGSTGYIVGGRAEIGYIFDAPTFFNLPGNHWFDGVGAFGYVGVSQGYTGQKIHFETVNTQKNVEVHVDMFYTPVFTFGATGKAYFLNNRLAAGLTIGGTVLADSSPSYEVYSSHEQVDSAVGTISPQTGGNKVSANFDLLAEYTIPLLPTMELILGGYGSFNLYPSQYLVLPQEVLEKGNAGFNQEEKLSSYFLNSFDFGLTFALGFKL